MIPPVLFPWVGLSSQSLLPSAQALRKLATQPISIPGERGFALEGITERPGNAAQGTMLRGYFRQCREEICVRLLEVFYTPQGTQSRYWLDIAVRPPKWPSIAPAVCHSGDMLFSTHRFAPNSLCKYPSVNDGLTTRNSIDRRIRAAQRSTLLCLARTSSC